MDAGRCTEGDYSTVDETHNREVVATEAKPMTLAGFAENRKRSSKNKLSAENGA